MKILQITASYKPAYVYGGPIMSVSMLAEQLATAGVIVHVITTTANGAIELPVETNQFLNIDDVQVSYHNRITKDHTHFSPALLKQVWLTASNYDIIHIHAWWNLVSVLSCAIALARKVPVIVSPRGTLSPYSFSNKKNKIKLAFHHLLTKPLLRKCFIHTTSDNELTAVKKILKAKLFFTLPNFIRFDKNDNYGENKSQNRLNLIFLSRIDEKKGLDILLNALVGISIPYRLSVVGDGEIVYVNKLKDMAKKFGISDHIDWLGFQGENKFELLHKHDLLILSSHDENFGNVIIESLSVGTAVLISDKVGLAEFVIKNDLGWVCSVSALAIRANIMDIYYQTEKRQRIRISGGSIIRDFFSYKILANKYITMYEKCISFERNRNS